MSAIAQIVVESRRYSGWLDARYPIGYWQAALALAGDASGGLMGIDLVFQGADPATLNSQMYSVERIGLSQEEGSNRTWILAAVNMGGPANKGFTNQYGLQTLGRTGGGTAGLTGSFLTFLPWFLGSQRTPGITASLSINTQNINGIIFNFEAEGYRWSPRSVLVDGGPQRPPTGLYQA